MVVCELTSHSNEKCETTLKMKDAVRVEIMKVDWDLRWGESRSTKPCPCKVASASDGSYSFVRRVRLRSFRLRSVPPLCFAMSSYSCVHACMRLLTLWLQIAL